MVCAGTAGGGGEAAVQQQGHDGAELQLPAPPAAGGRALPRDDRREGKPGHRHGRQQRGRRDKPRPLTALPFILLLDLLQDLLLVLYLFLIPLLVLLLFFFLLLLFWFFFLLVLLLLLLT